MNFTNARMRRAPMRGMGYPLYVNGQLFKEPVTISHVPGPADSQGVLKGFGLDPSMGALGSYALYRASPGMRGIGDDSDLTTTAPATSTAPVAIVVAPPLDPEAQPMPSDPPAPSSGWQWPSISPGVELFALSLDFLSTAGLAYHGYRRNNSLGWAIAWAIFGGAFPIVGWPVALAQGYGEPERFTANKKSACCLGCGMKKNGRRRTRRSRRRGR